MATSLLAGPGARAAVVLPAPAITVADGNSVIATATDTFGLVEFSGHECQAP
jgi:hypothetical protein